MGRFASKRERKASLKSMVPNCTRPEPSVQQNDVGRRWKISEPKEWAASLKTIREEDINCLNAHFYEK